MPPRQRILLVLTLATSLVAVALVHSAFTGDDETTQLEDALRGTEAAFARTMADRDLAAFSQFLSPEVVFFSGETTLRGPQAVSDAWARYFEADSAPFSWNPDAVAVLESGTLGFTSGPVLDPDGTRIGTFNSVWRRSPEGEWRIVFDRGCP